MYRKEEAHCEGMTRSIIFTWQITLVCKVKCFHHTRNALNTLVYWTRIEDACWRTERLYAFDLDLYVNIMGPEGKLITHS